MTEDTALMERDEEALQRQEEDANSVAHVLRQNQLIDELLSQAMKKDVHYGVIPGTGKKPSLLKPGAEALMRLFRLAPRYRRRETDLGDGHFKVDFVCELYHIPTGEFRGEGVGTASTMESKYRWRYDDIDTGRPVPKEYWNNRDPSVIGGKSFKVKKIDNEWRIIQRGERVENPDIADQYNTVMKMGKKRAQVDAVLTATGASAVFTQDIEETVEQETPSERPTQAQQGSPEGNYGAWDGQLVIKSGKQQGKKWADTPLDWIEHLVTKGNAMAQKELARRATVEAQGQVGGAPELPPEPTPWDDQDPRFR